MADSCRRRGPDVAQTAVLTGDHVLFETAAEVLLDLGAQESAPRLGPLAEVLRHARIDVGEFSCDGRGADPLFQVVSRRDERRNVVFTMNVPIENGPASSRTRPPRPRSSIA